MIIGEIIKVGVWKKNLNQKINIRRKNKLLKIFVLRITKLKNQKKKHGILMIKMMYGEMTKKKIPKIPIHGEMIITMKTVVEIIKKKVPGEMMMIIMTHGAVVRNKKVHGKIINKIKIKMTHGEVITKIKHRTMIIGEVKTKMMHWKMTLGVIIIIIGDKKIIM